MALEGTKTCPTCGQDMPLVLGACEDCREDERQAKQRKEKPKKVFKLLDLPWSKRL